MPDLKPVDAKDSKIRYKALYKYELFDNGTGWKLYRQPNKTHPNRRLGVSVNNAFDVLTVIYLKLGHPGRNKCFYGVDQEYYRLKREECY
jgi:hypothetical protein